MEVAFIDLIIKKLQWLLDNPEVTWSGSGIYALSLIGSAVLVVVSCVFRRKKKSVPIPEDGSYQQPPVQEITNQFNNNGADQNIAQGKNPIGKQVNNNGSVTSTSGDQSPAIQGRNVTVNYNNMPPEWTQYAEEFGVTKSALISFFKILEQEQVPSWELDSKLREIAERYKELLQRFQTISSDDPEVRSLKVEAENAIEDGRFAEAEDLLAQARERDREAVVRMKAAIKEQQDALEKRQLSQAASCVEQAKLQRLQYRHVKAAEFFQDAAIALPERCKEERAAYLGAAGADLERIAHYANALRLYEQSLSLCREVGNRQAEGKLLNNISAVYQLQGEYGNALKYLEQARLICREIGEKNLEGATLNNLSQLYQSKGDYGKALRCLKQSLRFLQEKDHKEGECAALNNIGGILCRLGDYTGAFQYYEHVLTISREIKDKRMESLALNNISGLYSHQKNYDIALQYLEESLAITQQIAGRKGQSVILNNIGRIYEAQGDEDAALRRYEQSLALTQEIGDKAGENAVSWNIGLIYAKQNEPANAEPYLSRAVELAEQLEHPELENWRETLKEVCTKLREQHK